MEQQEIEFTMTQSGSELEEDYGLLMKSMQVSVSKHLLDDAFTMIWSNEFYYKLIGYPQEEYEELFHNRPDIYYKYHHYEEELKKISTAVLEAISEGRSEYALITRMPVKGGAHRWVRMNGFFTQNVVKGYRISYTVITDVNDLVEMRLAQSITYNNIPGFVGKYLVKEHFHIELLEANEQFASFLGLKDKSGSLDSIFQLNMEANREAIISQFPNIEKGEHIKFLAKMQNKEGNILWMQANGDCIDWVDGCPVYLVIYIDVTDVTELRQMQAKLEVQAQQLRDALASAQNANSAKKDFLSRMSHEIRTPLNAIIGMTTIAAVHSSDSARVEDCLSKISYSSKHLLSIINDILDMSKIEEGKLTVNHKAFSLQQLMDSVTTIIYPQAAAKGVEFKESIQAVEEEEVIGDSMRVGQILINLLSNAVKFTPEGGDVALKVRQTIDRKERMWLEFTVSDNGRGMSEEFLQHLYEPFEQEHARGTNSGGTGLGMPITKNLVSLLEGTITVKSKVGKGTVFTVEIPFETVEKKRYLNYPSMDSLRVLVSDNDRDDCAYTSLLLKNLGIKAKGVFRGKDAVEEIRRAYRTKDEYDVCLIDWRMPDMDGIETTRQIRSIVGPDTLIIIITAYDYSSIEAEAWEAGANLFLAKPFFASSLYNSLLTATRPQKARRENSHLNTSNLLQGKRILLVEDNALNLEIAVDLLEMAGAVVDCVSNGKEAVDYFLDKSGRECDAILMDIQMPVMDGYQATRIIRASDCANSQDVPIIAMTADAFQEDVAAALEAGMNAHIAKPFDTELLYKTLSEVLASGK